jgi:hypothetical protein
MYTFRKHSFLLFRCLFWNKTRFYAVFRGLKSNLWHSFIWCLLICQQSNFCVDTFVCSYVSRVLYQDTKLVLFFVLDQSHFVWSRDLNSIGSILHYTYTGPKFEPRLSHLSTLIVEFLATRLVDQFYFFCNWPKSFY